jgi:hypothetical protein
MPRFVIHVGPHKTGSTYIQRRLYRVATDLRHLGIFVPSQWNDSPENPSHTGLIGILNRTSMSDGAAVFDAWRNSDHKMIVMSCEALCGMPHPALTRLRDLIGDNPIEIVYYVRRWSDLVPSAWQELVRQGGSLTFLDFLMQQVRDPERSSTINLETALQPLIDVFGRTSLCLVSYNSVVETGQDLFTHFAEHFLGLKDVEPSPDDLVNRSLPPEHIEMIRALNVVDRQLGSPTTSRMFRRAVEKEKELDLSDILRSLGVFKKELVINDNQWGASDIVTRNRTVLADCVVKPCPVRRFYNHRVTTVDYIDPDYMLVPGVADALRALRAQLLT